MRAFAIYSLGLAISLAIGSSLTLSCSDSNRQSVSQTGTASMRLTAIGVSGAQYRLRNGIFNITGTSSKTIRSEEHLTDTSVDVELRAGPYSITLASGWFLERAKTDGTFERLEATLLSSNPQSFEIVAHKTTNVRFRFSVAGEIIDLGGTLSIGIDIEEPDGGHADAGPDASIDGGPEADSGAIDGDASTDGDASADGDADAGVAVVPRFRSIHAGSNYTCAVMSDNTVRCWGLNDRGQLGNGTLTSSSAPIAVPRLKDVASLDVDTGGGARTCVTLMDGSVRCWGGYYFDSKAYTYFPDCLPRRPDLSPTPVADLSNVAGVSAGGWHACAALKDGTARCWGLNFSGLLGDGTTTHSRIPVAVSNLRDAVAVEAHASPCALLANGTVRCWGSNSRGSLGNGTFIDSTVPVPVSNLSNVISISQGGASTCALLKDGTARCWGANGRYQLGDRSQNDSPIPVPVWNLSGAVSISLSATHACAVLANGRAQCWGDLISGAEDLTDIASISVGSAHSCAVLVDGSARCWGSNGFGELGDWSKQHAAVPVAVRLPICGNGTVEPDEQCEPPNTGNCDESCRRPDKCGDGVVDPGEECDDGNQVPGDRCFECSALHYFILTSPPHDYDDSILRVDKRGHSKMILGSDTTLNGLVALALEPDGTRLYALQSKPNSCSRGYRILYLDPISGEVLDERALDEAALGYVPTMVAMTRGSDGLLYVIAAEAGAASHHLLSVVPKTKVLEEVMPLDPSFVHLTHDNATSLYVSSEAGVIKKISPATRSAAPFADGAYANTIAGGMSFDPRTRQIWIAEGQRGLSAAYTTFAFFRFDPSSGTRSESGRTINVGNPPTVPDLLIDVDGGQMMPLSAKNGVVKIFASGVYNMWGANVESPVDLEMLNLTAR